MNEITVRILSVTYFPEKYPLTRTHPPCTNSPQELITSSASLIWHPSGEGQTPSCRFPSPRPRRRLDQAGGPPQEDLGGGASNAERKGDSGVANALQDGGERREGERTKWRKGSVRFRLIPIDGTYKGKMVRTEEMSCPPGDRGVPLGCVLQFEIYFSYVLISE